MGIGLGDLLQIVDTQDYLGEECLNVYFYRWATVPAIGMAAYDPLLDSFVSRVLNNVNSIQNSLVTHNKLQIKNLTNGLDFLERVIEITGTQTVDPANASPSYLSLGFQMIRDSLATRSGYKRIVGLREQDMAGNTYIAFPTERGNIEDALVASLNVGLVEAAFPVIVKRPIPEPAGTSYVYSSVAAGQFKGLGTQNSRKP